MLNDESVSLVEIESAQSWQLLVAITEEQREAVGFLAFGLYEVAVGVHFGECTQHYIVGHEMCIVDAGDVFDAQAVERVLHVVGKAFPVALLGGFGRR